MQFNKDKAINTKAIQHWASLMFPQSDFRSFAQRHRPKICPFEPLIESVPSGAKVLDVGCGSGLMLGLLAMSNRLVSGIGFDSNAGAIYAANEMTSRLKLKNKISFKTVAVDQPWPEGEFNVVTMIDVMHHIPVFDRKECLKRVAEALPSQGVFVYKDMQSSPFWFGWGNRIHDLLFAREWISYMPKEEVISACQGLGLEVLKQKHWTRFWYGHELIVFKKY